jgi:GT2 family glycosyltransferase
MDPTPPALDIVIVTAAGSQPHIRACLESLRASPLTLGDQRVMVVDNASSDGTEAVVRDFAGVSWLPLGRNVGFSAASNAGVRATWGEHVLLLNPDAAVGPGTLDTCVRRLRTDAQIGILGCRLLDRSGIADPNAKRTLPTRGSALRRLSFADRVLGPSDYHTPSVAFAEHGRVEAVSGAFMMVRRAAFEQIGLLDEGYWMYGEDLDLCARAGAAGWVVWYEGGATALHVKGGTTGSVRDVRLTAAFHRAMGRYYRRHLDRGRASDAAIYAAILGRATVALGLAATVGALRRRLRGSTGEVSDDRGERRRPRRPVGGELAGAGGARRSPGGEVEAPGAQVGEEASEPCLIAGREKDRGVRGDLAVGRDI